MEFDKTRVYTAVNAEELKVGSRCIFANHLQELKRRVEKEYALYTLDKILSEYYPNRFVTASTMYYFVYLIEPPKEPKYKPFSSIEKAKEIIDKHGGWVGCKTEKDCFLITGYMETDEDGDSVVLVNGFCHSFQRLYDNYIFADDNTPCGELVED